MTEVTLERALEVFHCFCSLPQGVFFSRLCRCYVSSIGCIDDDSFSNELEVMRPWKASTHRGLKCVCVCVCVLRVGRPVRKGAQVR